MLLTGSFDHYGNWHPFSKQATNQDKTSTTPAQPTGSQKMEENKPTSTASAPCGSTSIADQENRIAIRGQLINNLHNFAKELRCPNPWSWAQEWASTCIGPSWKNWGMPSGNLTQTGLKASAELTDSVRIQPARETERVSSAPQEPTGEKTEKNDSYSLARLDSYRRQILDAYWAAPPWSKREALKEILARDRAIAEQVGIYVASPSSPKSSTPTPMPSSKISLQDALKSAGYDVQETFQNHNGTLLLVLRLSA
jgi:hypothetical protein